MMMMTGLLAAMTIAAWRRVALCHDMIVAHGPTLLAALQAGLVTPPELSICVIDSLLVDVPGFAGKILEFVSPSTPHASVSRRPRIFVPLSFACV